VVLDPIPGGRGVRVPVRETEVTATRRRVHVERDLPMKDAYQQLVLDHAIS
jgi:hypothetical protein